MHAYVTEFVVRETRVFDQRPKLTDDMQFCFIMTCHDVQRDGIKDELNKGPEILITAASIFY